MTNLQASHRSRTAEPVPDNLTSAQPGGGFCFQVELAWGSVRRAWLRAFFPSYLRRMAGLRRGDPSGCPHPVLDPRDLKYFRNRCTADWDPADDPFTWRDHLPVTRWGLAELLVMGGPLLAAVLLAAVWQVWLVALPLAVVLAWLVSFFRDPRRTVPVEPGLVVAPADGTVAEITQVEHDDFIGAPAVRIGIFLSIFNVHLNRAPLEARVIRLQYRPGKFLNALHKSSAWLNESLLVGFEETCPPHRAVVVRQIAGLFARRIVCGLRPGQVVGRGEKFGMIKLGSRTELILPAEPGLSIEVQVGQRVRAGSTVMARFAMSSDFKN